MMDFVEEISKMSIRTEEIVKSPAELLHNLSKAPDGFWNLLPKIHQNSAVDKSFPKILDATERGEHALENASNDIKNW